MDYHFVTPESFQQMIDQGELLEWAEIHGDCTDRAPRLNWCGRPRPPEFRC